MQRSHQKTHRLLLNMEVDFTKVFTANDDIEQQIVRFDCVFFFFFVSFSFIISSTTDRQGSKLIADFNDRGGNDQ